MIAPKAECANAPLGHSGPASARMWRRGSLSTPIPRRVHVREPLPKIRPTADPARRPARLELDRADALRMFIR
jgi:hypothetical protein